MQFETTNRRIKQHGAHFAFALVSTPASIVYVTVDVLTQFRVGVVLILISSILLLITSVSAPAVKDIAILKVMLTNKTHIRNSSVVFGSFGHCILDVPPVE